MLGSFGRLCAPQNLDQVVGRHHGGRLQRERHEQRALTRTGQVDPLPVAADLERAQDGDVEHRPSLLRHAVLGTDPAQVGHRARSDSPRIEVATGATGTGRDTMFRSRNIIVAAAIALCAASTAPALARVPDGERPQPARVNTHRCQHTNTTTDAAGRRVTTTTTYGARCLEA